MLIRYKSLDFALFEIKEKHFNDFDSLQITRQRYFAKTFSIPYKVITGNLIDRNKILIQNLRKLIGYVAWKVDPNIKNKIFNYISSNYQIDIINILNHFKYLPETEVYTNIVHLIHDGAIKAPLHKQEFDRIMVLSIDGESYESEFPF
jgi:hypothetical protein